MSVRPVCMKPRSAAVSAGAVIVGCGAMRGGSCYWIFMLTGSPIVGQESSAVWCRGLFGMKARRMDRLIGAPVVSVLR